MRLYTRADFIKLPAGTIYSRDSEVKLLEGLFCKVSGPEMETDWVEQDLLSEIKFQDGVTDGYEAYEQAMNLKETFQEFETTLDSAGRDGCFDDSDKFVVWNAQDVKNLLIYLTTALHSKAYTT